MATILLQAVGGAVGGLIGGPLGAVVGRALGGLGGYAIDSALFSPTRRSEGARLGASRIMEADEGAGVPRLYGTARIAGQVIWATRFEERRHTERQGGKGGRRSRRPPTAISAISRSGCARGRSPASGGSGPMARSSISPT